MKVSALALGLIITLVKAQSGPPQCGINTIISIISSSGCSITDSDCLCNNTKAISKIKAGLVKACKAPADQEVYASFFNLQCMGKPGFPITISDSSAAGSGSATSAGNAYASGGNLRILAAAAGLAAVLL